MSEINVLYSFDEKYAEHAGISMTSLLENNKNADSIRIFALAFSISDEEKNKIIQTVESYGRIIIFPDKTEIQNFIKDLGLPAYRGSSEAIARLFLEKFIVEGIDRMIYLDSDTIVTGDLTELMKTDMEGCPAAMVRDSIARFYKTLLGFLPTDNYYNTGVILYDMDKWRQADCSGRIGEYAQKVRNNFEAPDQDLINLVLKNEIYCLDIKYNLQPFHRRYSPNQYLRVLGRSGYYSEEEIKSAASKPVVLHCFRYLGRFPWHKDSYHPYLEEYRHYKNMSLWSNTEEREDYKESITFTAERILYRILPKEMFLWLFMKIFNRSMRNKERQRAESKDISYI